MHITKRSSKMKLYTQLLAMGGLVSSLSTFTFAHEGHDHSMQMDMSAQQNIPMSAFAAMDHSQHQNSTIPPQTQNKDEHAGHYKEHGGQIYQATQFFARPGPTPALARIGET